MSKTENQFYATFCANLLCLGYGLATGWTSAAIPLLKSDRTPLKSGPITSQEASIIGSVLTVGGIFGTLIFGYAANKIGRKRSIFIMAFPQVFGWILVYYAVNPWMLVAFRFIAGISAGGILTVISGYTTEIAVPKIRGLLGSTLRLFFGLGVLLSYIFGAVLPYHLVPFASAPFSVVFLYGFWKVPETPLFLLKKKRFEDAEKSLRYYRCSYNINESSNMKVEIDSLISTIKSDKEIKFTLKELTARQPKKVLIYGIVLMALNQFCGCFPMMNYTATIFAKSGSNLSPNVSSIVTGVLQIIGAMFCTFLVERAGRKILFSISAFGISFGLGVMSLYTYLDLKGYDLADFSWIPLVSFSFVMCIYNFGVNTLPFLYISEIVQSKFKPFTMTFCLALLFLFATIVIQLLSTLIENLGMHGTMLFFSMNSLIGGMFVVCYLPETKGKTHAEILKLMDA